MILSRTTIAVDASPLTQQCGVPMSSYGSVPVQKKKLLIICRLSLVCAEARGSHRYSLLAFVLYAHTCQATRTLPVA